MHLSDLPSFFSSQALRAACSLSDKEVALVIKEIAERTFKAGSLVYQSCGHVRAFRAPA